MRKTEVLKSNNIIPRSAPPPMAKILKTMYKTSIFVADYRGLHRKNPSEATHGLLHQSEL